MIVLSSIGIVNSVREDYDQRQFNAELLPLFIQHSRLEGVAALQDLMIPIYLGAAVAAAENATNRDVLLRDREWTCDRTPHFEFRRGAWANVSGIPTGDYLVEGHQGPKTWGFRLLAPAWPFGVTATTGYATLADVPMDMVLFILAAAAWMYDMREIATYSTMIQHADVFPLYLLDTWTIPSYA
jgi:hypothetical protein